MIRVITDHPVALDSPDHLHPRGAVRDNHINLTFNDRLRGLYPHNLSVLDLGCAGGGMVKTLVDQGHLAVGIEGSDWCKKNKALEWVHLANQHLFTADISKLFWVETLQTCIRTTSHNWEWWFHTRFKVITLWEVIEHIAEDDLDTLFMNIRNHLSVDDGIVVMSVSPNEEVVDGVRLHQTVHDQGWWADRLAGAGFHDSGLGGKFSDCMVRGPLDAPGSFHFVLTCIRQYVGNNNPMSDTVSDDGPPPGFIPAPIHPMDDILPDPTQGGDPLPITEVSSDPSPSQVQDVAMVSSDSPESLANVAPEVVSDPVPDPEVVAQGDQGSSVEAPAVIVVGPGAVPFPSPVDMPKIYTKDDEAPAVDENATSDNDHSDHSESSDQPDAQPSDDHPLAMLGGPYKVIADHIRAMEKKLNIEGWWRE